MLAADRQYTKGPQKQAFRDGRYWARTSDPQLVERAWVHMKQIGTCGLGYMSRRSVCGLDVHAHGW